MVSFSKERSAMRVLRIALAPLLLSACVTANVITLPAGTVDFRQYKAVRLVVLDRVFTSYSGEGIPILERWLKDMLQSQGYSLVDQEEDLRIEISVTRFQPGSRLLGWSYGFGPTAAMLAYSASFVDRRGVRIGELEGGKSYHGWEAVENPRWMTSEQLMMAMIRHSVTQIGQFIQNNGRLE